MPCFLYFVETRKHALAQRDLPAGMADVAPRGVQCYVIEEGNPSPSGGRGVMCVPVDKSQGITPDRLHYNPEKQVWVQGNGYWVGMWHDWRPTNHELARGIDPFGMPVAFPDNSSWLIPEVYTASGKFALPYWYIFEHMKTAAILHADMKTAMDFRKASMEAHATGQDVSRLARARHCLPSEEEWFRMCALLMSVHYRIGSPELSLLNTLDSTTATVIIATALGYG